MAATSIAQFKDIDLVCRPQRGVSSQVHTGAGLIWPEPIDPPLPLKQSTKARKSTAVRPGTASTLERFVSFLYAVIAMGLVLMMALAFLLNRTSQADAELAPVGAPPAAVSPSPSAGAS